MDLKREECRKLMVEYNTYYQETQNENKTLKTQLEKHKKDFEKSSVLATKQLQEICDTGEEITRISNASMDRLQVELEDTKKKLDEYSKKISETLARRKTLTKSFDEMIAQIRNSRNNIEETLNFKR